MALCSIVNNNCSDDTDQAVEQFKTKLPLVYIKESSQGKSRALNAGLSIAKGRLVIFCDDDVILNINWIDAYWKAFQTKPFGYFWGGPIESEFEGEQPQDDLLSVAPFSVKNSSTVAIH